MRKVFPAIALVSLAGLSSCVTMEQMAQGYQEHSAGHVGCQPEQITISDFVTRHIGSTWYATCDGKRFLCSKVGEDVACSLK